MPALKHLDFHLPLAGFHLFPIEPADLYQTVPTQDSEIVRQPVTID